MRRAHSEELLSEVGIDTESRSRSPKRVSKRTSLDSSGLLQVSDHPRMRHNSADGAEDTEENNYENFAHELSHNYLWTNQNLNTRELTNENGPKIQVDLNSTNSDSNTLQSITSSNDNNGILTVNSRPTTVSPERRLDMVLGSEMSQFTAEMSQNLARPIPTFNSFGVPGIPGIHGDQEIHRARPAYAPTPSPGESDDNLAPPLPARQNHNQPHSLPFFPYHQFPGRSVKPMRKLIFSAKIQFF